MGNRINGLRSLSLAVVLVAIVAVGGCRNRSNQGAEKLAEGSSAAENLDGSVFNNLTLEEADDQGKLQWKIKAAQVVYTPDQKIAKVKSPTGQLYQDGKPIYQIQAREGQFQQGSDRVLLKGEVVATDTQSGAVLRADQLEWQPKKDELVLKGNLRGSHPEIKLSAERGKLSNKQRQVELFGKVNAITTDPKLRMQSEHVIWRIKAEKVISDRPVQVQRLQGNQATDQANAERAEVDLAKKTAHLQQNAKLTILDPPLLISGNSLIWNVNQQMLTADQPLTALHRQQQVSVTANRGKMELKPKLAYFNGNVNAVSPRNQSKLTSDDLTWKMSSEEVIAQGNVVYVQPNPPATLRGARAVGKLQDRTVVVSGGRVVTEIVPQQDSIPGG